MHKIKQRNIIRALHLVFITEIYLFLNIFSSYFCNNYYFLI